MNLIEGLIFSWLTCFMIVVSPIALVLSYAGWKMERLDESKSGVENVYWEEELR
jgi:hypothetical protein